MIHSSFAYLAVAIKMSNKLKQHWRVSKMGRAHIEQSFADKKASNQNLFAPYIMAGDGGLDILAEPIQFLRFCGVADLEVVVPFSDAVADGPTVQAAGELALAGGTTLTGVLETLRQTKETRTIPNILKTYLNPIYAYRNERM